MSENSHRGFFSGWSKRKKQLRLVWVVACLIVFVTMVVPTGDAQGADLIETLLNPVPAVASFMGASIKGTTGVDVSNPFKLVINWALYGFFSFLTLIASGAVTLFGWVVKPENSAFFNLGATYELWKFVRDFFNLFFILVLLFSAFSTIFQVQQYHIKKLFLSVLIAALLVNFSFPISRFIVDAANVPMYFFLNKSLVDSADPTQRLGTFLSASHLKDILIGRSYKEFRNLDISQMIMAIVFMFIFAITLVVLAVLFTVRWIALLILIVFSAVGFAATVIPGLGQYSGKWWDTFLKYAFYGPAAALMLLVAIKFMEAFDRDANLRSSLLRQATDNAAVVDPNFFANIAFFTVPVILLWFAMGLASSFSIAGAGMVVGWGQKMAKGGLKRMTGASLAQKTYSKWRDMRKDATTDRNDRKWSTRLAKFVSGRQDAVVATVGTAGARRDALLRQDQSATKEVKKATERHGMEHMMASDLENIARTGDRYERAAAVAEMAKKGRLDMTNQIHATAYRQMRDEFGVNSTVFRQANNKLRSYDPVTAFEHYAPAERQQRITDYVNSTEFDAKKLGSNALGNVDFMRTLIAENAVSKKELEELRGKSNAHRDNIRTALDTLVMQAQDPNDQIHQRTQEMHFAHTGGVITDPNGNAVVNPALANNPAWQRHIFSRMDKENAKRLSGEIARDNAMVDAIMQNVNPGKYKDIVLNIDNSGAQVALNARVKQAPAANANARNVKNVAQNDNQLSNIG